LNDEVKEDEMYRAGSLNMGYWWKFRRKETTRKTGWRLMNPSLEYGNENLISIICCEVPD
jgi:hypothetical protein